MKKYIEDWEDDDPDDELKIGDKFFYKGLSGDCIGTIISFEPTIVSWCYEDGRLNYKGNDKWNNNYYNKEDLEKRILSKKYIKII